MSTTQMQPGPCDLDNRFFGTGTKSIATSGKLKRSSPQYSFGNLSETAAPRYLDKGMEVELLGRDGPGPCTATSNIASVGGQLEKTTFTKRVPACAPRPAANRANPGPARSPGPWS